MSSDDDTGQPTAEQDKPVADRWGWVEAVLWGIEPIAWVVASIVRLAAWVFVGILSSCS